MEAVTVVTLMKAAQTEEVGGRGLGSNGSLGGTVDSGRIVIENGEGVGTGVNGLGKDVLMCDHPGEVKITDGEITGAIAISNEALLNGERKRGAPQQGRSTINKPDTSHARLGSINSANSRGKIRDNFGQLSGAQV